MKPKCRPDDSKVMGTLNFEKGIKLQRNSFLDAAIE
jgi:hypothetical protein